MMKSKFEINDAIYEYDKNMQICRHINPVPFNYSLEYTDTYNSYGELGIRMSHLRLGVLLGALGYIPQSLLDVGYGNGDFLKVCKNVISDVAGSDIEPQYPIDSVRTIKNIYEEKFDVVCFFDSLEHFFNPYEIQEVKTEYIFISLPELHPKLGVEWFTSWRHRKPNEHIWHFSREGLVNFFNRIGYRKINMFNFEDVIRKNKEQSLPNILSGVFKKIRI